MKDFYAILDVPPTASQETIREQFLFLIQAWHPDKFQNPAQKAKAEEKCKEINAAYDVLKNPQKRAIYDRQRRGQSSWMGNEERQQRAEKQRQRQSEELAKRQAEEQRRKQAEKQRQQAGERLRRADYERQGREKAEEIRVASAERYRRDEAEAPAHIRELVEYAKARQKRLDPSHTGVKRTHQNPIRVLIVDDQRETRANIRRLLGFEPDIEVCGEAPDGREAIIQFNVLRPDVTIMDINMTGMDGIAATEIICRRHPEARVIMLTLQNGAEYIKASMLAGACDYLLTPPRGDELGSAIRKAAE